MPRIRRPVAGPLRAGRRTAPLEMRMPCSRKPGALVILAVLPLAGCRVPNADQLAIGGEIDLPSVSDTLVEESLPEGKTLTGQPTPVPLNRVSWNPIRFEVPGDRPPHRESYARQRWFAGAPRARGAYPTPLTALDPSPHRWDDRVDDQWLVVQSFVEDIIRAPFLAIDATDDSDHVRGGEFPYARARRGPWLGEIVGSTMPGDPLAPRPEPGTTPGEPGVIRRFAPLGDRPDAPAEPRPAGADAPGADTKPAPEGSR